MAPTKPPALALPTVTPAPAPLDGLGEGIGAPLTVPGAGELEESGYGEPESDGDGYSVVDGVGEGVGDT
jgi:hypothetical protein